MANDVRFDVDTGESYGTVKSYMIGFALSIALTLGAFYIVAYHALPSLQLYVVITLLAIAQLFVQLVFFMHLSKDSKARWNVVSFVFSLVVVLILVLGTLWIMYNLYENMGMGGHW